MPPKPEIMLEQFRERARPTFHERAACRGLGAEMFYPPSRYQQPEERENMKRAVACCQGCPVRLECLQWAFANEPGQTAWGVRGGLRQGQRRTFYRRGLTAEEALALTMSQETHPPELEDDEDEEVA